MLFPSMRRQFLPEQKYGGRPCQKHGKHDDGMDVAAKKPHGGTT